MLHNILVTFIYSFLFSNYINLPLTSPFGLPSSPSSTAAECLRRSLQLALFRLKEILMTAKFSGPAMLRVQWPSSGRVVAALYPRQTFMPSFILSSKRVRVSHCARRRWKSTFKVVWRKAMYRVCYVLRVEGLNPNPLSGFVCCISVHISCQYTDNKVN